MRTWRLTEAFEEFKRRAENAGLSDITSEFHPESFGSQYVVVSKGDAGIRLVWDGKNQVLNLEISHGPPEGKKAGWLDIFDVKCVHGVLHEEKNQDTDFSSSIDYALELMASTI